jgi:hypothetical protein
MAENESKSEARFSECPLEAGHLAREKSFDNPSVDDES